MKSISIFPQFNSDTYTKDETLDLTQGVLYRLLISINTLHSYYSLFGVKYPDKNLVQKYNSTTTLAN